MTAPASHITTPEHQEAQGLDHDVRILPKLGGDTSEQDSVLLAFDPRAHEALTDLTFADSLERTFGVRAESPYDVPLSWEQGNRLLTLDTPGDSERINNIRTLAGGRELGGFFGIQLAKEGFSSASDHVAAGIAALISEVYEDDEQRRVLYNHTQTNPVDPIEITGPGYNLAEEATGEHPTIDLREIVAHPVSLQPLEPAPGLARASFA